MIENFNLIGAGICLVFLVVETIKSRTGWVLVFLLLFILNLLCGLNFFDKII